VSDSEDDLRAVAESIAKDADRLKDVEQAKTELAVDDPALLDLAEEGAQLIDEIAAKGPLQEALVREVTSST
jgi:guanyl-specific ribonuclease Sa